VVCSERYLKESVLPEIKAGLEASGRERKEFTAASIVTCAISDDTKRAMEAARATIAFYATVRTYEPPFRLHGFTAETARIRDAFLNGDVKSMVAAVSDDMVNTFAVVGSPDECRRRIDSYGEVLDLPILSAPHYYIDFEEVREYQRSILEVFGS
ncbi:MAG: LLM class flavin-dependent oxidoreductase, partial [Candidatus Dadabacteria bacterium]|nr:LLM class flavin-dependent oxidoreductase [Candidatus Dadabacteria bacterium]